MTSRIHCTYKDCSIFLTKTIIENGGTGLYYTTLYLPPHASLRPSIQLPRRFTVVDKKTIEFHTDLASDYRPLVDGEGISVLTSLSNKRRILWVPFTIEEKCKEFIDKFIDLK